MCDCGMFLFVVYILFHKKNSKHTNYLVHVSTYITTSYYYNVQQPNFMKLGNTLSDMNDRRPLAVDFIDALGHLPSGRQAVCQPSQRCSLSTWWMIAKGSLVSRSPCSHSKSPKGVAGVTFMEAGGKKKWVVNGLMV